MVTIFFLFIPLNFILFFLYIPLLYMCFIYWFIRLCKYVKVNATTELKPYDEFYYPSTLFESYVFFIKTQTVYKAYLNSFATIYNILKTLQQGSKSKKTTLLTLLKLLVKTIPWLFIKFITSLPRTVILDSYWCSRVRTHESYQLR